MLEYNLDAINLKIVKLDASEEVKLDTSEDDSVGLHWVTDDKYFDEIWATYIFKLNVWM